ncbi:hypothetical protein HPB50_027079 [Hyalomma asiaticum]|uniref:Uncharacterized protein n=1 Tax=Hyalomma asiaticum TaxID=266040 RepID=A0ACB7RXK2_HYAAI|nr:hypothetical protein HPB50_027079 [Hyalomma asiaticum]
MNLSGGSIPAQRLELLKLGPKFSSERKLSVVEKLMLGIMAPHEMIVTMLLLTASAASYSSSSKCDFSVVDLDDVVEGILAALPKNYTLTEEKYVPIVAGLEVGTVTAAGLNKIKRYGAVQAFCVRGQRFLQVDFINDADVAFYVPWRTCSGDKGLVIMYAEFSRLTVLLRVDRGGFAEKYVVRYEGPTVPVHTHGVHFIIEGAGTPGRLLGGMISRVLPSYTHELWNDHFFNFFTTSLRKALE